MTYRPRPSLVDTAIALRGSTFLGEAEIPLVNLEKDVPFGSWYRLSARGKDDDIQCGSVRLALKFSHELVLPLSTYNPLVSELKVRVWVRCEYYLGYFYRIQYRPRLQLQVGLLPC